MKFENAINRLEKAGFDKQGGSKYRKTFVKDGCKRAVVFDSCPCENGSRSDIFYIQTAPVDNDLSIDLRSGLYAPNLSQAIKCAVGA